MVAPSNQSLAFLVLDTITYDRGLDRRTFAGEKLFFF